MSTGDVGPVDLPVEVPEAKDEAEDSRDKARVCCEPEKMRWECLLPFGIRFCRGCSFSLTEGSVIEFSIVFVGEATSGRSPSFLRSSFLFFIASCRAQCLFKRSRPCSALWSSSLSSSTRLSCVAKSVRKVLDSAAGEALRSCASSAGEVTLLDPPGEDNRSIPKVPPSSSTHSTGNFSDRLTEARPGRDLCEI